MAAITIRTAKAAAGGPVLRVESPSRSDALVLCDRLPPCHWYLVERDGEHWDICTVADQQLRSLLPRVLDAVARWSTERGIDPVVHVPSSVLRRPRRRRRPVQRASTALTLHEIAIAGVAHEIRTPLTVVYGALKTLEHLGKKLPERNRLALLGNALEQAERLIHTVEAIETATIVESSSLGVKIDAVEVRTLTADVVASLPAEARSRIALVTDRPVAARTNEPALKLAIRALIDNALTYSPEGSRVEIALGKRKANVRIDVRDEGPGISAADREAIFGKYRRLDADLVDHPSGAGLGLYIASRLMEGMGGRLQLDESPRQGSRFTIEVPAEQPSPEVNPPSAEDLDKW